MIEALREVSRGRYDDKGYSNELTIANLRLKNPAKLNNYLTYTYGKDDDRFPLHILTEGQGTAGVKDIDTEEWTWDVMGRSHYNDQVVYYNSSNEYPGIGGAMFDVEFKTHWLIEQYGLIAPDGVTQVRIMKDLGEGSHGGYVYRLKLTNPNPSAFVDVTKNLAVGKYWTMTAPTVSASYSKGNRSNVMGPGSMKSQLEYHRYTKEIGGNLANEVVVYEFDNANGGKTNLWINEEMRQFDIQIRIMDEERLWLAEYNREVDGTVSLVDLDNGNPILHTAGMMQICRESNYLTYGEKLSLKSFERAISDVINSDTDSGKMDVVLACGEGFIADFDDMIKTEVKSEGFLTPLGDKMIGETKGGLSYGNYFRQYKTVGGHTITLKTLNFLSAGTLADNDKANGNIHPRTGKPMCSHQAFLLDMSKYNGENNVRKTRLKGRIYNSGVIKGLTPIPPSWGGVPDHSLATEVDKSSYHILNTYGLQVDKTTKFMQIKCVM